MNAGVGTYKDDSRVGIPGEGKTILLAGHNNTFFNDLQHAEAGATVTITTHYGVYTYEVTGTEILDYQDETAYDFTRTDENLILYTCYPFDALASRRTVSSSMPNTCPAPCWTPTAKGGVCMAQKQAPHPRRKAALYGPRF